MRVWISFAVWRASDELPWYRICDGCFLSASSTDSTPCTLRRNISLSSNELESRIALRWLMVKRSSLIAMKSA